jgi:acetate---CoA ligase (ADP-forming)
MTGTGRPVGTLLAPRSVAVVGASPREDSIGFRIIRNLRRMNFPGEIVPVNPRYPDVSGLACCPSLLALPRPVDAAFIAVPAAQGPALVDEAGRAGIRAVLINASGYADGGPDGRALQERLVAAASAHGIALCGPNNMGIINVHGRTALWTAMRLSEMTPGPVAIISQSGSIAIALSQDERRLGLAYVISAGNEAVCTVADYLLEVVNDDRVGLVLLFLEAIRDPARFVEAARRARARGKPVIALKVGRSEGGRTAVAAHTGALSGEDAVYDAFLDHHGVVRVRDLDEMMEAATLFSTYPSPSPSRRVVAVTLSGGEAALAADLGADLGLRFPDLSTSTRERLQPAFPPFASPRNPVDAWGLGWDPERFRQILTGLLADDTLGTIALGVDAPAAGGADAHLVMQMATICADLAATAAARFVFFNNAAGCGPNAEVRAILAPAGIPYLSGMRSALAVIGYWTTYGERRQADDPPRSDPHVPAMHAASGPGDGWPGDGWKDIDPRALDEVERFSLLRQAGIPMIECAAASTPGDAVAIAERLRYPVALKLTGPDIAHKTERGLVRLGLRDADAVRAAFDELLASASTLGAPGDRVRIVVQPMAGAGVELIVGVRNDPAFGSLTVVGLGGVYVELLREPAIRLGPVTVETAAAMLRQTRAGTVLDGFRGQGPYDVEAAARAVVALSALGAATHGTLAAIEVNPLIVRPRGQGAVGVDVVIEGTPRPAVL